MLIEAFRIEGRRGQVLMISRSCASVHCEPCQGLTAAALSRSYVVPRGSFEGDNYPCTASMRTVEIRCTALTIHSPKIGEFFIADCHYILTVSELHYSDKKLKPGFKS